MQLAILIPFDAAIVLMAAMVIILLVMGVIAGVVAIVRVFIRRMKSHFQRSRFSI